ncbi:MAG: hypothetical protein IJ043_03290 [Clostridia bacterium]|nr:hypothetical protein [Clostridia bacterium]
MAYFYRMKMMSGGDFAGITAYPVHQPKSNGGRLRRRSRCNSTKEAQAWGNKRRAEDYFFYLIHNNYGLEDQRLDLDITWPNMPKSVEEFKRIMRNFVQRLRRLYRRWGLELRLVWIPEITLEGRYHVHAFINGGVPIMLIQKCWRIGRANSSPFQYDREGLRGYIHYVFKKPLVAKHWCATKNLKKPQERCSDYILQRKIVEAVRRGDYTTLERALPGWEVVNHREEFEEPTLVNWDVITSDVIDNEVDGQPYIYIKLCRRDAALSF